MGMSTHVVGFKPPVDRWKQMKAVWDACEAAEVPLPAEVSSYFGGADPDPSGVEVWEEALESVGAVREYATRSRKGFEIIVANIPPDVAIVRVYNSW